jgi:hypothetical protein
MGKAASSILPAALLCLLPETAIAQKTFARTAVSLERNVTDQDAEIRFEVTATNEGLANLRVMAPDSRTVVDFKAPDTKLGLRQITLESPEPRDDRRLQADFPAGAYRFVGATVGGTVLEGTAMLSHAFPPPISLTYPRADQGSLPTSGIQIRWRPVSGLASVIVVVEQEATGRELRVSLPGVATGFTVPEVFLSAGTEYKVAIGTVSRDGNSSFVETSFKTAERK